MKKNCNIGMDGCSGDSLDVTKRLYRKITEILKKLEEHKVQARNVTDVFSPSAKILRSKLKDYCEKLIISDPVNHKQRTGELLWRKCFYEVIAASKKLRKGNAWSHVEKSFLSNHLLAGIGFYHHLIFCLLLEYDMQLPGVIDFAYSINQKEIRDMTRAKNTSKVTAPEVKQCVTDFIHRSLICLGDLSRYQLDIEPNWKPQIAMRYYKMAIAIDDKYGMPHNQLGTLTSKTNYGLDAVYHYLRCILCLQPFEGAEENLKTIIATRSYTGQEKCLSQLCVARLLLLLRLWDNSSANIDKINEVSQILLSDIEKCLSMKKTENVDQKSAENENSIENYLLNYKNEDTVYVTDEMIFKIIVICLMKIMKVQTKEQNDINCITAFVVTLFSQVLKFVVMKLQKLLLNLPMENEDCNSDKIMAPTKGIAENKSETESVESTDNKKDLNNTYLHDDGLDTKTKFTENLIKPRRKSKNLLKKYRRPLNRRNSSDSDLSDEEVAKGSSSEDEVSSENESIDVSDYEDDVKKDESFLSDDTMLNDSTDDEKGEADISFDIMNRGVAIRDKFVQENENENQINGITVNGKDSTTNDTANMTTNLDSANDEKLNLDPIKVLKFLRSEIFTSIKICCDWLQGRKNIIKTCAKGSESLISRLTTLLNLINMDCKNLLNKGNEDLCILPCTEKAKEAVRTVPLPEDMDLKGLKILDDAHKNIDWDILKKKKMTNYEETLLRSLKIVEFGHYLSSVSESGVTYDEEKNLFIFKENNIIEEIVVDNKILKIDESKAELMKRMGVLWLKSEIQSLEKQLQCNILTPFLVPDHEAFARFLPIIKQFVYANTFIVIIPSVVISALDEMKKNSSYVRGAIRWIESQLQHGTPYLKAQRPDEQLTIPSIRRPKYKEKEAWVYYQIVECCNFLTHQSKAGSEFPVVTLLTGMNNKKMYTSSHDKLAKSVGVNFEHIGAFHAKWKVSIKSHG